MSVPFVGRLKSVAFVKETTRGTYNSAGNHFWVPWVSTSIETKVMKERQNGAYGNIADSDEAFVTGKYCQGTLEGEIRAEALGLLLSNVIGATPTSTGGPAYTHTYTLADTLNQHQSLTIVVQDPTEIGTTVYQNAMINTFNVVVEPTGMVKYSIEFMASSPKDWARLTPAFTASGDKYLHQHLAFKLAANVAGIAAASTIDLKRLEFTFNKNILIDWIDGTLQPGDIHNQSFSFEGNLTLNYEDRTYRNYMLDNTFRAMEIKFLKDANDTWTMQFPYVDFSEWEPSNELDNIVTQTLQFKANYDATNAAKIISTCTLINGTASY